MEKEGRKEAGKEREEGFSLDHRKISDRVL